MPYLGQDIATAFMAGLRPDPSVEALFVQTVSGDVIMVYDPIQHLPDGAVNGQIVQGTAVQVGDALYFVQSFLFGNPIDGYDSVTSVARLNRDGTVETVAIPPGGARGSTAQGDPLHSPYAHNGIYHLEIGTGFGSYEIFAVGADGTLTQETHLGRGGYPGALPGVATVNGTTFVIGDQQTPNGPSELYRIRPSGAQELVFSDGASFVRDVESFAGKAWFITEKGDAQSRTSTLWSIGETGVKRKVTIGPGQEPIFLDTDGGGLVLVYGNGSIARVNANGTFDFVFTNSGAVQSIFDVCTLNGEIYFTGQPAVQGGPGLYHVTAGGTAEAVAGTNNGFDANGLHVSGGKLWFTGTAEVSDGFGGHMLVAVSYSIDDTGKVTVESGLPGHRPDLFVIQGYDFTLDFPDAIIGTDDVNGLIGTGKGELLSGLGGADDIAAAGGNDTVAGGNGNDDLTGERGNDLMIGGSGLDRISGGFGADTLTGGLGADTFVFSQAIGLRNTDTVTDFTSGLDKIALDLALMPALGATGALAGAAFWAADGATRGHDADDRVIFNSATGALYYDAEGQGPVARSRSQSLGYSPNWPSPTSAFSSPPQQPFDPPGQVGLTAAVGFRQG